MKKILLIGVTLVMLITLLGAVPVSAVGPHTIDFESDTAGAKPNGWQSADSMVTFFTDSIGADLQVGSWYESNWTNALAVYHDDPSYLIMDFSVPMQSISLDFGNDDPGWANPGDEAVLTLYFMGTQVGQQKVVMNVNDLMDQTISFSGAIFDSATFYYDVTLAAGLIEVVDNIELEPIYLVVDKHWSYTNVAFALDNDGDGLIDEDPVEYDIDGITPLLIDNDGDGLVDEDPAEYDEYYLGDPLPQDVNDAYLLEATVGKNDKIKNINPGQFYAVSTVEVLADMDELVIFEDYSAVVADIGEVSPINGGGCVVVVKMVDDIPLQILDAMDEAVDVNEYDATVTLDGVVAGEVYMVYVKFAPTLKGMDWPGDYVYSAINLNGAGGMIYDVPVVQEEAQATIAVVEKLPEVEV